MSSRLFVVAAAVTTAVGCTGPSTPSPIEDEPVCADFETGPTRVKMRGGLKVPVLVELLDGKKVIGKSLVRGRRLSSDPVAMIGVPDGNDEYTVRFSLCENERAPGTAQQQTGVESASYECGQAKEYATAPLVTKRGDASSRKVKFLPPQPANCWMSDAAPPPPPPPPAPEPTAAPTADPAAEGADAGVEDAGAAEVDAAVEDAAVEAPPEVPDAGNGKKKKKKQPVVD